MYSPIVDLCLKAWRANDLSTCKPLGFDLVGWAAILTAIAGVIFFSIRNLRKAVSQSASPGRVKGGLWRSRFTSLCRAIKPLMDENGRIFREFGPNSGAGGPARTVRQNLGIWRQMMPTVVQNNARIRDLINTNKEAIPAKYGEMFKMWINHIDAFEAHAQDPLADYRQHQFPREVAGAIHRNA